jgi:HAD superfamily hydrolase (TIGR01484 family)
MRFHAIALDYDGTIAHHGNVDDGTVAALERLKKSGRRLILVTGRQLDDLRDVFPQYAMFDRIVAENGALLYRPSTKEEKPLGEKPPDAFVHALRARGVDPVAEGRVIVATWTPHETTVLRVIHELGLELQIIFNKGAVMVLPAGINKASGLNAALEELGLSSHNVVGVGDAENDHAFLQLCECAVATENALPSLKEKVDLITQRDHGPGVCEVIEALIAEDLETVTARLTRHHVPIGETPSGEAVVVDPLSTALVVGSSGGGKSTLATAYVEHLAERNYQFVVIDPEGDYTTLEHGVVLGDAKAAPTVEEALEVLASPRENVSLNLLGVPFEERPAFFETLLPRLAEMRAKTGRPHVIILDEAHHFMPNSWRPSEDQLARLEGAFVITVEPEHVAPRMLAGAQEVIIIGKTPQEQLTNTCKVLGEPVPKISPAPLNPGEALIWSRRRREENLKLVYLTQPRAERLRHRRKYAEGDVGPEKSFYFKGPDDKLNLRAHNLMMFARIADGVDDDTWLFHLERSHYSQWFREAIKDPELAAEAEEIETRKDLKPDESRQAIANAIHERYTLPS